MTHSARILVSALMLGGMLFVNGCVVAPRRPPPPRAAACVWVPGHYNAHGYWVPAYCR
jgi:hypothetical protein